MLPPETLKRIHQIEFFTRRLVRDAFAGAYHSAFKGRGIEFESVRPYQPGDDIRDIDWNVTARAGAPYVKQFVEERELTVLLALDASASCQFGSTSRSKRDVAAELGAAITLSALNNNDKVGALIFSNQIEQYTPPRKGRNHALRIIRDLLEARPVSRGTDLAFALQAIDGHLKQRAIVFLMSDFLAASREYARKLMAVNRRHDLVAVVLSDPLEIKWPDVGLAILRDSETGGTVWIDSSSRKWRRQFELQSGSLRQFRDAAFQKANVDKIDLSAEEDYVGSLIKFFQMRASRRHVIR